MPRALYVQYTNPAGYPPLEHSSRILADRGWDVLFLGTGAQGADGLRFPGHPRIATEQWRFCRPGWRQKIHYGAFQAWALWRALRWRADWVYVSDPMATPAGLALSWLPGIKVVYHEHDSPAGAGAKGVQRWILRMRQRLARRAEICVLPNEERAERVRWESGREGVVHCVWNCPAREEVAPARDAAEGDSLWLLYHGSIVPSRLPLTVLEAMAALPEAVKLRVVGYETVGARGYLERLRARARELGIEDRIHCVGTVATRAELLAWCRRSDVGLALMPLASRDENERTMAGASNKAFDYLACGLALIVSDLKPWTEMFVDPGYATACRPEAPETIAAAIRVFLNRPGLARWMGEQGRRRIAGEWNYESRFQPVLGLMEGTGARECQAVACS